jgi:hypothetical protein
MKPMAAALLCLVLAQGATAKDAGGTAPDTKFLLGFLAGDYRLLGQKPDSGAAYVGKITLRETGNGFAVTRVIAGASSSGTARIETSGEGAPVLRIRFPQNGVEYAATYLWHTDLDNYPRLTGYVYRAKGETKSPGLEALFHIAPTPVK